jgi:hypothetical protein
MARHDRSSGETVTAVPDEPPRVREVSTFKGGYECHGERGGRSALNSCWLSASPYWGSLPTSSHSYSVPHRLERRGERVQMPAAQSC